MLSTCEKSSSPPPSLPLAVAAPSAAAAAAAAAATSRAFAEFLRTLLLAARARGDTNASMPAILAPSCDLAAALRSTAAQARASAPVSALSCSFFPPAPLKSSVSAACSLSGAAVVEAEAAAAVASTASHSTLRSVLVSKVPFALAPEPLAGCVS